MSGESGAKANLQAEENGQAPVDATRHLISAVERGEHQEAEKILIDAGADVDVNGQDEDGGTALHAAVRKGDLEMMRRLLKKGARSDIRALDGRTPFHVALELDNPDIIEVLLQNKFTDSKQEGPNGKKPREMTANLNVVTMLDEHMNSDQP